jgi:MFS family permease
LPLYLLESKGIARERTIYIPFFFALGMLLFSNVAGRLGDHYGHLLVMRALAAVGMCMVLGFVLLDAYAWMAVAVFVAGATLASISPVSLALLGVVTAPRDYSRSNAIYNACYAAGMLVGPKASSLLFARFGGGAMLLHLAALWSAFVVFTVVYWKDDPKAQGRGKFGLASESGGSSSTPGACEVAGAGKLAR